MRSRERRKEGRKGGGHSPEWPSCVGGCTHIYICVCVTHQRKNSLVVIIGIVFRCASPDINGSSIEDSDRVQQELRDKAAYLDVWDTSIRKSKDGDVILEAC